MPKRAVLLIDDDQVVREAIRDILDIIGVTVFEGEDGQSGIKMFEKHQTEIGLAIVDMIMPTLDGYETLQQLKEISPDLHVILSSGHTEASLKSNLHLHQPDSYLSKPFEIDELLEEVEGILATVNAGE